MEKILLIVLLFTIPTYLKAQDFPIGDSKDEIRGLGKTFKPPFQLTPISESDTCDVFKFVDFFEEKCYYRNNICYRVKTIVLSKSLTAMESWLELTRSMLGGIYYKKVNDSVWTDKNETEKIELFMSGNKYEFVLDCNAIGTPKKYDHKGELLSWQFNGPVEKIWSPGHGTINVIVASNEYSLYDYETFTDYRTQIHEADSTSHFEYSSIIEKGDILVKNKGDLDIKLIKAKTGRQIIFKCVSCK